MNDTDYWPLAREYLIWNATVAALQFWAADLKAHVLSNAIEQVYNAFFYTMSTHLLHQQSEEVLFGCFMSMLNAALESKLTLEDKGCESRIENFNIPTTLRWTPRICHVSSDDNISFDPTTLHNTGTSPSHHKHVWCPLSFILLTMKKVLQLTFHPPTAPHHHRTLLVLHSRHATSPSIPCVMT